jgi:hypothetical protein
MLLIKARVRPSTIHGLGLFAEQFIPSGTIIWRFQPGFDVAIPEDEINQLSAAAREQVLFCRVTTTVFPITPIIPIPYKTAIPCSRAVILSAAKKLPVATTK